MSNKKEVSIDVGLSLEDLQDLINGEEFNWTFDAIMQDGQLITVNTRVYNEDEAQEE